MGELSAVARFFAATDGFLQHVESTWWGAVVTDPRCPDVYDLNYARVETGQPDLRLDEVEATLLPALYRIFHRHGDLKADDFHQDHDHVPDEPCNEPNPTPAP